MAKATMHPIAQSAKPVLIPCINMDICLPVQGQISIESNDSQSRKRSFVTMSRTTTLLLLLQFPVQRRERIWSLLKKKSRTLVRRSDVCEQRWCLTLHPLQKCPAWCAIQGQACHLQWDFILHILPFIIAIQTQMTAFVVRCIVVMQGAASWVVALMLRTA